MIRKIAVCDDQREAQLLLGQYLARIEAEGEDTFEILYFSSGEDMLKGLPQDVQVVLMDIRMGEITGIETARMLQKRGYDFALFLITSRLEYALEGYDVHAFCFLPKPVQYVALKQNLEEVFSRMDMRSAPVIPMQSGAEVEMIDTGKLLYVEVLHHNCTFVYAEREAALSVPLSAVEEKLAPHGFFRCHKGYLVNLRKVLRITQTDAEMEGGRSVPVSKYRRKELLSAYARHAGGAK